MIVRITASLLIAFALSGCTSLQPDASRIDWLHVSHPTVGPPFGDKTAEDSINAIEGMLLWRRQGSFVDAGLAWQVGDGGFYGLDLIFSSRVGREFTFK